MSFSRALLCFLATAGVVGLVACASLKDAPPEDAANAATDAPPAATEGGATDAPSLPGSDGGPLVEAGVGNGDPRWPQWRLPSDAPDSTGYTVTNGADGAIIIDKITGLQWQDTVPTTPRDFDGANAYCDALVYDGQSDWRLPTRIEAMSIMVFKPVFDQSAVAGPSFSTISGPTGQIYWTSSRIAGSTNTAYGINEASVGVQLTDSHGIARCVRGGPAVGAPIAKQFVVGSDTVTDPTTGLIWEKTPPETSSKLDVADTRCKALVLGGHPMRLPGVKELASIVDETKSGPSSSGVFGSYSVRMFTSNERWTVNFNDGTAGQGPTGFSYHSRCVAGP